jgi:hypothetical protein
MGKDVGGSSAQISVPFGQIADQEILEQFLGCKVKVGGVSYFARNDLGSAYDTVAERTFS